MDNFRTGVPFFSIVIPVYNRYDLVKETINSVLNQEMQNFEIVIIDDGSTDGSGKKLDEVFGIVPGIRIIHQPNLERGAARNRGIKEAKGEYVVLLDSDDRLLPNHLSTLFKYIESLNYPDFIATKYEFLRDNKRVSSDISKYNESYYDYQMVLDGNPLACNVCLKKNNPKLILFIEDRQFAIKEDWMFFIQNLRHQRLYLIDQVTLLMLDHPDRSMQGDNSILIGKTLSAKKWIIENVELNDRDLDKLEASVGYFCSIHSYLNFERKQALQFIFSAFNHGGVKAKYIVMLAKILAGKKMISLLRR